MVAKKLLGGILVASGRMSLRPSLTPGATGASSARFEVRYDGYITLCVLVWAHNGYRCYVTAPAGLLGRLRVLALALQMTSLMAYNPAIRWLLFSGLHGVVSAEQIALLAPKTSKIRINSDSGAVWSTLPKGKKRRSLPISPLRAV